MIRRYRIDEASPVIYLVFGTRSNTLATIMFMNFPLRRAKSITCMYTSCGMLCSGLLRNFVTSYVTSYTCKIVFFRLDRGRQTRHNFQQETYAAFTLPVCKLSCGYDTLRIVQCKCSIKFLETIKLGSRCYFIDNS